MLRATTYDDLSYESLAYPQSHPDRLATVAALFGLRPAPVDGCRVLEIGCAAGGNLISMAAALPGSEFVGIDISGPQIAHAQRAADALGLENLKLHVMGLESFGQQSGTFDYIIAHGVYSWVAQPLQEELLALAGRLLRPRGVAYVSYNTQPGWGIRAAFREMVQYQTRQKETLAEKLVVARSLFAFWETAFRGRKDPHATAILEELTQLRGLGDFYIAHEYLEDVSSGCYFHEFIAGAQQHGLQFLGEAEMQAMSASGFPAAVREGLRALAKDVVHAEQHLDFLRNRAFRQTLLCRAEAEIKRAIPAERLLGMHIGLAAVQADGGADFRDADGITLRATDAFAKAALEELSAAWPQSLHFAEVVAKASARSGIAAEASLVAALANCLVGCYAVSRNVEFTMLPRRFVKTVSERPRVSALTRWQCANGSRVTNARHENIVLGATECGILGKLDGTRSRADLSGEYGDIDSLLHRFAQAALLVG